MSDLEGIAKEVEEPSKEEREALLLAAMGKIVKVLEPFQNSARRRVIRAVIGFYELKGINEEP